MEHGDLIEVLEQAKSQFASYLVGKKVDRALSAMVPNHIGAALTAGLKNAKATKALENTHYKLPTGAGSFSTEATASHFIARALVGVPAKDIIDSYVRIAATRRVSFQYIFTVTEVHVESTKILTDNIKICPPEALPKVHETTLSFNPSIDPIARALSSWGAFTETPTSAIVVKRDGVLAIFDGQPAGTIPTFNPEGAVMWVAMENDAKLALDAVTLSSSLTPKFGPRFPHIADPGWPDMQTPSYSGHALTLESSNRVGPVDASLASELAASLTSKSFKPIVGVAISKLRSSRQKRDPVERAIDLGTIVEIMLMHDASGENTEISYKIGLRGAWLLGSDPNERLRIFELIRKIYTLRSKAVHNGFLKPPSSEVEIKAQNEHDIVADRLASDLISKIVRDGGWPDWKLAVLDAAPPPPKPG